MFTNKSGEFVARYPGELNGSAFQVLKSNDAMLYLHDHVAQTNVDHCSNTQLMLGPNKSSVFLRNCENCIFVVFCQQLRMRDCTNCQVMLYSHTEPIVEACTGISFSSMTYVYPELLSHLQSAATSPWTNKWQDIYDFTPHRTANSGVPNWQISTPLNWRHMAPLGEVSEKINKVREFKPTVKNLSEIKNSDLALIRLEFDEEAQIMPQLFDVGPHFNDYAQNIIKGVIPAAQYKREEQDFSHSILLLVFVEDFAAIFDSTNAILAHEGQGAVDLTQTLQYKLLITCGTFVKVNKKTKSQVVWVEETRSVMLNAEQKQQLVQVVGEENPAVAEDPNLMAIAIEFRLKGLKTTGSDGQIIQSESKAFMQLKLDCEQLVAEHGS